MTRIRHPFRALGAALAVMTVASGTSLAASPAPLPSAVPVASPAASASPAPSVAPVAHPGIVRLFTSGTIEATGGTWEVTAPHLAGTADPAIADAVNATIDGVIQEGLAAFEAASTLPPKGFDGTDGYQVSHSVALLSPELLSVRLLASQYAAGAAHPTAVEIPLTFDLRTGARLALADLFRSGTDPLPRIARVARQELRRQLPRRMVPADEIRAGTQPRARNYQGWAVTADGLEITFGEYQVGPYAIGMPVVVVPWARLADLVDPAGPVGSLLPPAPVGSPDPAASASPAA